MVSHFNLLRQALAAATLLALSAASSADVTARVDRPTVDLNESFTLEIEVNESTDLEPDLSVLDENFHVGQVSKLSNTSIFNGEIRRTLTWTIALMPKVTGTQQVPPISLGNEQSNPVTIIVNEPTNAPPGEADVFVTSEVDVDETYVQAQILYRIRIYRAVATRQPALREPTITGAEALVELAGDERQYEAVLNGRAYNVIERVIALYPQESGEIQISPARFEARVLRDGEDLERAWQRLGDEPLILEAFIPFEAECSLIGVRGHDGETRFWPLTRNVHDDGILALSRPGGFDAGLQAAAELTMHRLMDHLDYRGVMTIEFFLREGRLLVNEVAPRVHNSGHWTIDGATCSQFENHVRAVAGLPLGATDMHGHALMFNWIGEMPDRAAALAVDMVPICTGSDTGGSVRVPSAWNDLVGLKTTPGRLSNRGVVRALKGQHDLAAADFEKAIEKYEKMKAED